ncbi:MAG: autotransporter-associated beta strand repeat-containing protein [bacterium]
MSINKRRVMGMIVVATVLAAGTSQAQSCWTNVASGVQVWSAPGNWTNGAPSQYGSVSSILKFNVAGTYTSSNDWSGIFTNNGMVFGAGTVTLAGGTNAFMNNGDTMPVVTNYGTSVTINNSLVLATNTTFAAANNATVSGVISGSGSLTKSGAGTLKLNKQSTYSGATYIQNGKLLADVAVNGQTILPSGNTVYIGDISGGNSATLQIGVAAKALFNGNIVIQSGNNGTAQVSLNTYPDAGIPLAGTITLGTANQAGHSLTIDTSSQATAVGLQIASSIADAPGATSYGVVTFKGQVNIPIYLSGNNTYAGGTLLNDANTIVSVGNPSVYQTDTTHGSLGTGAVTNNGALYFARTDNYGGPFSNAINGTGLVSVTSGILTLAGANSGITGSSGMTIASGASLILSNSASANNTDRLKDTMPVTLSGGSLGFVNDGSATTFSETIGTVTLSAGANTISANPASGGASSTVTLASLSRSASSTVNFMGAGLGTVSNKIMITGYSAGAMPVWVACNGGAATYDPIYGVTGPASYTDIAARGPSSTINNDGANYRINSAGTSGNIALGSDVTTIGTLVQNFTTSATVDTANKTLRSSGVFINTGMSNLTIGAAVGAGALQAASPSGTLSLGNFSASTLTVNAPVTDNSSASGMNILGNVTLKGLNTFTGPTYVTGGTLTLGNTGIQTLSGNISGDGSLTQSGSGGTTTLSGNNTYSGVTTVSAGKLKVGSANAFTGTGSLAILNSAAVVFDLNGYNATFVGNCAVNNSAVLTNSGAPAMIEFDNCGSFGVNAAGFVVGNLAMKFVGNGVVSTITFLNTNCTFSGGLTLLGNARYQANINTNCPGTGPITVGLVSTDKAGIFLVSPGPCMIPNDIVVNSNLGNDHGGNFRFDGVGNILSGTITANVDSRFWAETIGGATVTGRITGPGGINIGNDGGGAAMTLTLNSSSSPNDYNGNTTIQNNNATLLLGANNQIPNGSGKGSVSITGILDLNGYSDTINGLSGAGVVSNGVAGTTSLTVGDGDATSTFSGVIKSTAGTLSLAKTGIGMLTLSAANTYSGATTVNAGQLTVSGAGTLPNTSGLTVSSAGRFNYLPSTVGTVLTLGSSSTLALNDGSAIGLAWNTTTANVIKVLGSATVGTGTGVALDMGFGYNSGTTYTILQAAGGLDTGNYHFLNPTNFTATVTKSTTQVQVTPSTVTPLSAAYWKGTSTAGLTKIWAASDGNTNSNWAITAGGVVQVLVPGSGADVIISATSPTVAPTGTILGNNMNIRSLSIQDTTSGLSLDADGNTLTIAGTNGIAMSANVPASTIGANVTLGTNQTWSIASTSALVVSGVITPGASTLTKTGSGTIILSGASTLGGVTVTAGILKFNNAATKAGPLTLNGGTIDLAADVTTTGTGVINGSGGSITSSGGRLLLGVNGADWTTTGTITNNAVIADGTASQVDYYGSAGTYILKGASTYTGATALGTPIVQIGVDSVGTVGAIISSAVGVGTLTFGAGGQNGNLSSDSTTPRTILNPVLISRDATMGNASNNGKLTFSGPVGLVWVTRSITANSDIEFAGVVSNGGITKAGTGTLTLSGVDTFTNTLTISAGTLSVAGTGLLGSGNFVTAIANNATFAYNSSATQTLSNVMSGTGRLLENAAGTLILAGANTYSGGTIVSNGTLVVNGSVTGAVTVVGGTLGGTGVVAGVVTNYATITAGVDANTFGVLTVSNLVMNAGSTYNWKINISSETNDLIYVNGNLSLPSVSTVNVAKVTSGQLPNPAVLITGFTNNLSGINLGGWVINGALPNTRVKVAGSQLLLYRPKGTLISIK